MIKESSIESVQRETNPALYVKDLIAFHTNRKSYRVEYTEEKWSNILRVLRETGI